MDYENKRSSARYDVNLEAEVTLGDETHISQMLNLSLGGAFIGGLDRIPMGTQVVLSFSIPNHESPIEVDATVRWSTDLGVGLQFGSLRAREVWSLNKYFEELSEL